MADAAIDCPYNTINPDCGTCWAHHPPVAPTEEGLLHYCPECHRKARRARGDYKPWEVAMMEWSARRRERKEIEDA